MKKRISHTSNALDQAKLERYVHEADFKILAIIDYHLSDLIKNWLVIPDKNTVNYKIKQFVFLEDFIDFEILELRLNKFLLEIKNKAPEEIREKIMSNFITLNYLFPEMQMILNEVRNKLYTIEDKIFKAKLWLFPFAVYSKPDANIEASIYFKTISAEVNTSKEIEAIWLTHAQSVIESGYYSMNPNINSSVVKKAELGLLTIGEIADIFNYWSRLELFFFSSSRYASNSAEASFFRAVDILDLKSFDPWVNSLSESVTVDIKDYDNINRSVELFYWCRSNLAIEKFPKIGIHLALNSLTQGERVFNKPWKVMWNGYKEYVDYINIASSILFCSNRILRNSESHYDEIVYEATSLIMSSQLYSGAWPVISTENKGDIEATCIAIHALSTVKPEGWQKFVSKASNWLISNQLNEGCWSSAFNETVTLTVLVLDSLKLAEGSDSVTYIQNKAQEKLIQMELSLPVVDYSGEKWFKKRIQKIESIDKKSILGTFRPKVAIQVATQVELDEVLKTIKPLQGRNKILKITNGIETYYLGVFGVHAVVVVMSTMASIGITGSTLTAVALVNLWDPEYIILIGIAFGADSTKQKIGDVLVSESIIPYENQRIGDEIIFRNSVPPASPILINRIRNAIGWKFKRPDSTPVKLYLGPILSGEKLVDNLEFKKLLLNKFPTAIGGEMESSGLHSAAGRYNKQWIVIKGICDWGDGHKNKEHQQFAAASAISLCEFILNDYHIFDEEV